MIELNVKFPGKDLLIVLNPHRIDFINDKVDQSWCDSISRVYNINAISCTSDLSGFTRLPTIAPFQGPPLVSFAEQVIIKQEIGILHNNDHFILVSPHQGPHNENDDNHVEINRKLMADLLNATAHPRIQTKNLRMLNFEVMNGVLRPGVFQGIAQAISEKGFKNEYLPNLIVIDIPKQYIQRVAEIFRREVPIAFVPEKKSQSVKSKSVNELSNTGNKKVIEILKKYENVLFYPSSGFDFKSFLFTNPAYYNDLDQFDYRRMTTFPDLYIHTDYSNLYPNGFWDGQVLYNDNWTSVRVLNSSLIAHDTDHIPDPQIVHFEPHNNQGKIYFLRVEINSHLLGCFEKDLLYGIYENSAFFSKYLIPNNIKLSHIINIRGGGGFTGGNLTPRFTELFLGMLNVKYVISDGFGRNPEGFHLIKDHPVLKKAYISPENKNVIIEHIKQVYWSGYGIFQGDAFISRVHHF